MTNGLNNTNTLLVHCASGDDDPGWVGLKHADEGEVGFPLLFCFFICGGEKMTELFKCLETVKHEYCKDSSYWVVKPQGFYMANYKPNFPGSDWNKEHDHL